MIDHLCPTAGLGLGLPGLKPGLADELQLKKACEESDKLAFRNNVERAVGESDSDHIDKVLRDSETSSLDRVIAIRKNFKLIEL